MSLTDEKTTNYALPLPHPANEGADDCLRLRKAISGADAAIKTVADAAASKADATDIDAALVTVNANLALKANLSVMDAELAKKADVSTVTAELAKKADSLALTAHCEENASTHAALQKAIEAAADKATWEKLLGKPEAFPPSTHGHEWAEISGTPIIAPASTTQAGIIQIASDEEATAGLNTTKAVTPKQLKEAIPVLVDIQPLSGLDTVGIGHANMFGLQAKSALVRGRVASFTVSATGLAESIVQTLPATDGAATIQITPPEGTPAGTILTLAAIATDNSGYTSLPTTKDVTVTTAFVAAPTLTEPEVNAIVSPISVTFTTSAFSTVGSSDTHVASRYRLTTDAAGNTVVYDSERTTTDKLTHTATLTTPLTPGVTLYAWAQHEGITLGVGSWSAPISLATASVLTPAILSPEANISIGASIVTLVTSDFACTGGVQDTHISTDWRITSDEAGNTVTDETLASSDKTTHIFTTPNVTHSGIYFLWARHTGNMTGTSGWAKVQVYIIVSRHGEILCDTNGNPAAVIIGSYASNGQEPWTILGKQVWLAVALASWRGTGLSWTMSANDKAVKNITGYSTGEARLKLATSNTAVDSNGSFVSSQSTEEHMDDSFSCVYPYSEKDSKGLTDAIRAYNTNYQAAKCCRELVLKDYGPMDLPSMDALMRIYQSRDRIDDLDPTANANTSRKLSNWGFMVSGGSVWSVSEKYEQYAWSIASIGLVQSPIKYSLLGVIPVLEISATTPA